jgi:S-adenosylmethionine hydrolase
VDPGVGGERKPLVLESEDYLFVGPDNGCFTLVLKQEKEVRAYELVEERFRLPRVSHTFHGRDIFAPAAAHLSLETPPEEMGPAVAIQALTTLAIPDPVRDGDALCGEVIWVDHFGNLVTNVSQEIMGDVAPNDAVEIGIKGERVKGLKQSYEEGKDGEVIALWGSAGFLELSLKQGNLSRGRAWGRGEKIWIRRSK